MIIINKENRDLSLTFCGSACCSEASSDQQGQLPRTNRQLSECLTDLTIPRQRI